MKLQQGQIWRQGAEYYRIVEWARLTIVYKTMSSPTDKAGPIKGVTKKQFCRLIKGGELLDPLSNVQTAAVEVESEVPKSSEEAPSVEL